MRPCTRSFSSGSAPGFSLIELMVVVAIVAVLTAIALPAYWNSVSRGRRVAAEACLADYANEMERYNATHLRYDQDEAGVPHTWPILDCASPQQTGAFYSYSAPTLTATTFLIQAVPQGVQASRDATCGTLGLDQLGTRSAAGPVASCW